MTFAKRLVHDGHVRTFVLEPTGQIGWEARQEEDSRIIRQTRFEDWHRVELARFAFERQIAALENAGWVEA